MTRRIPTDQSKRRLIPVAGLILAVPLCAGVVCRAEQPQDVRPAAQIEAPGSSAADIAGRLPDDVDLVVVVSRGAELRSGPAGELVGRAMADGHAMDDLTNSWSGLAEQLGWTREQAFDRLLGRRVVIATRATAAGRTWAVLSEVDGETEKRLFEKLQVAPRSIVQGHQILAIEKGKYELTIHHDPARTWSTIVLGPAGNSDLFDGLVTMLAGQAPTPLQTHSVIDRARALGSADVLVLGALDAAEKPVNGAGSPAPRPGLSVTRPEWSDFAVIATREEPGGLGRSWDSRVVVRQARRRAELERVPMTSDASFEALAKDSLLAILQNASISGVLETELPLLDLFKMLPFGADVGRPAKPAGVGGPDQLAGAGQQFLCLRVVQPRDRIVVSMGVESKNMGATIKRMDEKIASVAGTIEQRFGSQDPPPMDMNGAAPCAARVLQLRLPNEWPFQEPLVLAWAYPTIAQAIAPGTGRAPAAGVAPNPGAGWWTLTISQSRPDDALSPTDLVRREGEAVTADPARGRMARWVWLGAAEPRALEEKLPQQIPDYLGFRSVMRRLDYADLRLSIGQESDIRGHLRVRLSAPSVLAPAIPAEPASAPPAAGR